MKSITSLTDKQLEVAILSTVCKIEDLQHAGKLVPKSLVNRWIRLYKEVQKRDR